MRPLFFVEGNPRTTGTKRSIKVSTPSAWEAWNVSAGLTRRPVAAPSAERHFSCSKSTPALLHLGHHQHTRPACSSISLTPQNRARGPFFARSAFAAERRAVIVSFHTAPQLQGLGFRVLPEAARRHPHRTLAEDRAHLAIGLRRLLVPRVSEKPSSRHCEPRRLLAFACSPTHSWASSWSRLSAASNCLDKRASAKALSRRARRRRRALLVIGCHSTRTRPAAAVVLIAARPARPARTCADRVVARFTERSSPGARANKRGPPAPPRRAPRPRRRRRRHLEALRTAAKAAARGSSFF